VKLVQPAILMLLAKEPLHGYAVVQRLGSLKLPRGEPPDPTGIYRVLKSMQAQGLLACSSRRSSSGPVKRLYCITPSGKRCLSRWTRTLREFAAAVTELLQSAQAANCTASRKAGASRRKGNYEASS